MTIIFNYDIVVIVNGCLASKPTISGKVQRLSLKRT
nr:MAG TPA: hypothetical protein [Herelleviridae sp.]